MERAVDFTDAEIEAIPEDSGDAYLLQQHDDRKDEFKTDLKTTQGELLFLGLETTDDLFMVLTRLSKKIFDCGHKIKRLLGQHGSGSVNESKGVRLPKLECLHFAFDLIVGSMISHRRKTTRSITRNCIIRRKDSARPKPQVL